MLCFPNAKINLGLHITSKRADGFHNIETIFYPVPIYDALEINDASLTSFNIVGDTIPGDSADNLVMKAYNLLKLDYKLAPQKITLLKKIPSGAGLGGGSADAVGMMKLLNDRFELGISDDVMEDYARKLGADCAFFVRNTPVFAFGRGDEFAPCNVDLTGNYMVVIKPTINIPTAVAFSEIQPAMPEVSLIKAIQRPICEWKSVIGNDFEKGIFKKYPEIGDIKQFLYDEGALFAQMSGSGSAVYGIFNQLPDLKVKSNYSVFYKKF